MNIYSLARIFELKMAIAADKPVIDYEKFKNKALSEIIDNINGMAKFIKTSPEVNEAAFALPSVPLATFGEKATQGIEDLKQIISGIYLLDNSRDKLTIENVVKPLLSVSDALISLSESSGSDKWGIMRPKYLNALEIFGDYYTSQGAYGDRTKLNSMVKRALEVKLGSLTNALDFIATRLRNPRQTGCLDILKKLSEHGLVDNDRLDSMLKKSDILGDTTRVTRKLENHEKEQILHLFNDFLGISRLGLPLNIHTWNKYVDSKTSELLSDVFRAYLRSPSANSRSLLNGEAVGPKNKILSRTTVRKLEVAADSIRNNKITKDQEEKLTLEKMFGSPDVISPIKPKKDIRTIIEQMSGTERALWHKIPIAVQIKVLNGQIDLDSALEIAESHAGDMVGAKLDASLFE